jgi:glycosyltransferase involved in cell wall biosynthesis
MNGATKTQQAEPALVSIGLPVYNEAEHLAETLESLLAQDYPNIEIVICDNASTDRTPDICAEYAAKDARVRSHRNEQNVGGIENFNRVFQLARGEFFMWAGGHDLRPPTLVSKCVATIGADPAIVLCYPQIIWVDQEGGNEEKVHEYVDTRGLPDWLPRLNVVLWSLHGGFPIYGVFRTSALKQTSVYTQVYSPDMALLIELAMIGKFAFLPEPALRLRRARDYGDIQSYVAKHFKNQASGKATTLYWRMAHDVARRVSRHARTLPGKIFAFGYVLSGTLINFRWMLVRLRELDKNSRKKSG